MITHAARFFEVLLLIPENIVIKKTILFMLLLSWSVSAILPAQGEVYTLKPSGGDLENLNRAEKLSSFLNLAPVTELFSSNLIFNGNEYHLNFMRLNLNLEALLAALKHFYLFSSQVGWIYGQLASGRTV